MTGGDTGRGRTARGRYAACAAGLAGLLLGVPAGGRSETPRPEAPAAPRSVTRSATRSATRSVTRSAPLPRHSTAWAAARTSLPRRFRVYDTARYVVLSDADPVWTRNQAERLERTLHQFRRFARRLGIDHGSVTHKLVCVLFDERDDYADFATAHDDVVDPWIAGYYAPATERIVFYHGESNPSVVEARATLRRLRDDVRAIDREATTARRAGRAEQAVVLEAHGARFERHLRQETSRVDAFTAQVDVATLVHEAIHQLMFHTGAQKTGVTYPVWISEGIAAAFETDDTRGAFGPDFEYAPRRAAFERLLDEDRLLALAELVTLTRLPNDEDFVHVVYHQSYALVRWLERFRRSGLRSYLEMMREQPPGAAQAARTLELFERAFGNVDDLDRAWRRHESGRLRDEMRTVVAAE